MEYSAQSLKVRELYELLKDHGVQESELTACNEKCELVDLVKKHNIDVHKWKEKQIQKQKKKEQEERETQFQSQQQQQNQQYRKESQPKPQQAPPPASLDSKYQNMTYYEILGVDPKSDQSQIKKAYYVKARECHPDKNPDDPKAEALFKAVGEAYAVLSDEAKRKIYDEHGKEGLSNEGGASVNMAGILRMIFGGGVFDDLFGDLSSTFDSELTAPEKSKIKEKEIDALKHKLLIKLEPHIHGGLENFKIVVGADLEQKLEAPGAGAILLAVGKIYVEKAKQFQGNFLGLEGILSSVAEFGNKVGDYIEVGKLFWRISSVEKRIETKEEQDPEFQEKFATLGIKMVWGLGKIHINSVVTTVCEAILEDKSLAPTLVVARANALRALGEMYISAAVKSGTTDAAEEMKKMFKS